MNARVFLVVAVAVILLFKNAETPGAFLRHQVVGRAFEAAGWEVVSLDIVSTFAHNPLRHPELGLHDVSGALRHGLGVFSSPVAGFSMTFIKGSKCAMISRALSTSASPSRSRRGPSARGCIPQTELPAVHGAPALGGRDPLQVRNSVQKGTSGPRSGGRG